jgi:Protein kinase domain
VYELQAGDPQRMGPYWIEARLGAGGMGRVYLGRSPGGRHVAIKVIRPELAEDGEFRARFAREVAAARKVSGIFTAPVVDADLDGPVPWLATSYVPGPPLSDVVAARGPLDAGLVLALAAGLAEGLAVIHAAGVVHRDLKPSNVLLAEDGPRLIDFGISRSMEASPLTGTGTVVGSPGFMSPEQAQGRDVGPPSDIFSLGAVLAFAAAGEGPFGEGSTISLLYRVVTSEPNTNGLPAEIRPMIDRCLAKDPWRRPTAAQLLTELSTVPPATQALPGPAPSGAAPSGWAAPHVVVPLTHPPTERAARPTMPPGGGAPVLEPTVTTMRPQPGHGAAPAAYGGPGAAPAAYGGPGVAPPGYGAPGAAPAAYGGPGVAPPGYGGPVAQPKPRRPVRRGWLIATASVAVLAAAGAGVFLGTRAMHTGNNPVAARSSFQTSQAQTSQASPASPTTSAASSTTPATPQQGATAMAAIGGYLERSAAVRPSVQQALDGVQSCSESPSSGEATIQQAIDARQGILNDLQTLPVSGVPNGGQLAASLTTAMQESVNADRDFQSYMQDFANAGSPCGSDPRQDSNYAAGLDASTAATNAKNTFLGLWNPMAPGYGQPTYSSGQF